ncbi:MAG: iron-sulfur cluster assembly scaffold protein [Sphingomonas bacterium]|nr:iron-sulfur cluster assembly scaffold protein [Sphingomonas bacterium]
MTQPLYTLDILRLAASIPGQRVFAHMGDAAVLRSATCGSRMAMRVTLDDAGRVASLEQAVEACAFGQAAAALVGTSAVGLTAEQATAALTGVEHWLDEDGAEPWPGLNQLDPARARRGRHGAILLPFRALVEAIEFAAIGDER